MSYFMKIRPVGAELFHAERRKDRHVTFDNFAKAPKADILVVNWYITMFETIFFNYILTAVSFESVWEKTIASVTGKVKTQHFRMP